MAPPFEKQLRKHRVIGIRHTLKVIRDADLISAGIAYPVDAVDELIKTKKKADNALRHRRARSDSSIPSIIRVIEKFLELPKGSVQILYPSGRKAGLNATVGSLRRNWERHYQVE